MSQQTAPDREDEIDLSRFAPMLRNAFSWPFHVWYRYRSLTITLLLLAAAGALVVRYTTPLAYRSSFVIRPNNPKDRLHLRVLGDIQALVHQQNTSELKRLLKLNDSTLNYLGQIELYNSMAKPAPDSVNYTEIFIYSSRHDLFPQIQSSIVDYLETTPYYAKITRLQHQQINMAITQIDADLAKLDSLKKYQLQQMKNPSSGNIPSIVMESWMNPVATYTFAADRMARKSSLLGQQAFSNNFEVIKNCAEFTRPVFPPRLLKLLIVAVLSALLMSLLIGTVRALFQRSR